MRQKFERKVGVTSIESLAKAKPHQAQREDRGINEQGRDERGGRTGVRFNSGQQGVKRTHEGDGRQTHSSRRQEEHAAEYIDRNSSAGTVEHIARNTYTSTNPTTTTTTTFTTTPTTPTIHTIPPLP